MQVGTKQLVNIEKGQVQGAGFTCKESGVTLRDSLSYLDHINGKKQQKMLGLNMHVDRSSVDQVKERFAMHKASKEIRASTVVDDGISFSERVRKAEEEEWMLKEERRELKRKKSESKQKEKQRAEAADDEDEMAAMMGFGNFVSSKK